MQWHEIMAKRSRHKIIRGRCLRSHIWHIKYYTFYQLIANRYVVNDYRSSIEVVAIGDKDLYSGHMYNLRIRIRTYRYRNNTINEGIKLFIKLFFRVPSPNQP